MDFFLDQNTKDLVLVDGDFRIITNQPDQLVQRLFIRLKTFIRDLFWNPSYGIDYLNKVYGLNRNKSTVDALFINEIQKEEMVDYVIEYESEIRDYKYGCKFSVKLLSVDVPVIFYTLVTEEGLTLTDENGNILVAQLA